MSTTEKDLTDRPWQIRVAAKREQCLARIPAEWRLSDEFKRSIGASPTKATNLIELDAISKSGILSPRELDITEIVSASHLLNELRSGEISAEEAAIAFSKRAAVADQLTSCLTETFFDKALERARFVDDYLKREKRPIGPFHGLPISLKDCFCIKGHDTTIGFVSYLDRPPATRNSTLVDLLLHLGAVLYCKTNVPQTMMVGDSENNIFGRTLNPHNTSFAAGGSSGGEGALIALRGSILGVGTDVAGSIRIPSSYCGLYGFRPTADRVPFGGQVNPILDGIPIITPIAGPMASSFSDLELFFKTIFDADPAQYDSTALAVPWISPGDISQRPLRIGLLPEEPDRPLHPPVRRCLAEAAAALRKAGHTIVELPFSEETSANKANTLGYQFFSLDPLDICMRTIKESGEPLIKAVQLAAPPGKKHVYSIDELACLNVRRRDLSEAWRQVWVNNKLDILLAPTSMHTAVPHDSPGKPLYTLIWNVLDYPACVLPYGKSSKELDPETVTFKHHNGPDYVPEIYNGVPRALQVVAPRFCDEKCLATARIIDEILNERL